MIERMVAEPLINPIYIQNLLAFGEVTMQSDYQILNKGEGFFTVRNGIGGFAECTEAKIIMPPKTYIYRLRLLTDSEMSRYYGLVRA